MGGRRRGLDVLDEQLRASDLVVSCTGAVGIRITATDVRAAMAGRTSGLVIVDLALPHDVDPAVAGIDGVSVVGLLGDRRARRRTYPRTTRSKRSGGSCVRS